MALVGPHVNRYHAPGARPNMADHVEAARHQAETEGGFRVRAVSMFVGGPQNRTITLRPEERTGLRELLRQTQILAIAHSSYTAVPWKGDPDAARFIREEAEVCREAGIRGLVVHLPKLPVEQVMRYIARLYSPAASGVRIYLEIPAIPKGSFYETPAKLSALFRQIRETLDPNLDHFGLCVDTAHLWTCGVDVSSYDAAAQWIAALERSADVIPPQAVMCHLNDSERERGRGPDTHAPLAQGKIWGEYEDHLEDSGLAAFLDYANRHETPVILERKPKESLLSDYHILREMLPSLRL
jgi:endonuclease IV